MESAFHVSSNEDNMAISLFRKAADAIVAKSELAAQVSSMQANQYRLDADVSRLTTERNNMDDTIRYLTSQLTQAKVELADALANNDRHVLAIADLEHRNATLDNEVLTLRKERDDAQFDLLDEREEHAKTKTERDDAKAKLAAIQSALGLPQPAAEPEVSAPSTFRPEPAGDLPPVHPEPSATESGVGCDSVINAGNSTPTPEAPLPTGSPASPSQGPMANEPVEPHPWWAYPTRDQNVM